MSRSSIIFNGILAVAIILVGVYAVTGNKKIAYVNTTEVFNAFKMTTEIDADVKMVGEKKQLILDSITEVLKQIQAGVIKSDDTNFIFLEKEFLKKRNVFADEIARLKQVGIEKVWTQINQYVMEFGKEEKYDVILGANGGGSLMYAKETINITKEITDYVNKKYEGNK